MVAGSAAFFLEGGDNEQLNTPYIKCKYKTGKCSNERSSKRNGQPHMLCLYHRDKANKIQRKFDRQKRQSARMRKSSSSSSPSNNDNSSSGSEGRYSGSGSRGGSGATTMASAFSSGASNQSGGAVASSFAGLLAQEVDIYSDSDSSRFSTDSESSVVLEQMWRDLPHHGALLVAQISETLAPAPCADVVSMALHSPVTTNHQRFHGGQLSHEEIDFLYAAMLDSIRTTTHYPPTTILSSFSAITHDDSLSLSPSSSAASLDKWMTAVEQQTQQTQPTTMAVAAATTATAPPLVIIASSVAVSTVDARACSISSSSASSSTGRRRSSGKAASSMAPNLPLSGRRTSVSLHRATTTARLAMDLSPNHLKLLYLVSLYAVAANSTKQNERWIRHVPLLVLMFEGIVKGVFGFDYAPASMPLSFKGNTLRRWINVSREGKAAIDDLWELRLVNGIKLSSDDFQPVTAYQVSSRGLQVVARISSKLRQEVDLFIYPPSSFEKKLLQVTYDGSRFVLKAGAYSKKSEITESEDVSYVSSPFLPQCLRSVGYYRVNTKSNRHRAFECALGVTNISKSTNEAITLGDVYALVGEWVPFGSNQIVALNERMGALDRCQGGILTSFVDAAPTDAQLEVPVGQTQVKILDYDFVRFINFEAESHFPETKGIVQVEHFGMHLNCDGSLIYGIKVEAILDRQQDDICIDHLARLLVDVHQDSSMLVNDLLSRYQLSLLNMLYLGDSFQRNKYNCIIATQIQPKLPAMEYLKNANLANELAQVVGDLYACYDLSPLDVLIVGKAGCLVSGPHVFRFEHVLTKYVGLVCREMFIKNFFARTFVLDATLKEIRQLIHVVHREPAVAMEVRNKLAVASKDTILLAETLEYLLDSLEDLELTTVCSSGSFLSGQSDADVEARLMQVLALQQLKAQTIMRCHDSIKLMENTMLQLEQLQMIAESTVTNQLEIACQRVHLNTRELIHALSHQQKTKLTLEATQFLVSGLFVFDVIDRLTGATFHVHLPQWALDYLITPVVAKPFLWFVLNLVVYALCLWLVRVVSAAVYRQPLGWCTVKAEINKRMDLVAFENLLQRRTVRSVTATQIGATSGSANARFRCAQWQETDANAWANATPLVELMYDEKHGFALFVTMRFDGKHTALREEECLRKFHDLLVRHEVLEATEKKKG